MLRRNQTAPDLDGETREDTRPETELRVVPKVERQNLDGLRVEVQRKLAATMDVGSPDPAPAPEVERIAPKVERRRLETLRTEVRNSSTVTAERSRLGGFRPGLRGRWRLKPSRIVLLLVALLAGGLAAYLATQRSEPTAASITPAAAAAPAALPAPPSGTRILVAKGDIGIGQRLSADSVEWQDWPQNAVRPEYVTTSASPQAIAEMTGSAARFEIFPGDPIRKDKLALPGQGYLSAVLDSGMRGVSVSVTPESASGGFILPDDHVDVVMTRSAEGRTLSQTILHNVRVLAIDSRLGQTGQTGAPPDANDPKTQMFKGQAIATLELDQMQAEVVINAATLGKLSLELRSLTDQAAAKANPPGQGANNAAILISSPFWSK